jgi:hypothetical protein
VTTLGWTGVGLLIAAAVVIVIESIVAAWWGRAVAKRGLVLSQRLEEERVLVEADLQKLRLALEETQRLWRPYRLVLRWLQHPLVIALLGSYRRRLLR